jgi:hypothetical protein
MNNKSLIELYKAEYLRTNGKEAKVELVGGWFKVNGNKGVSRTKFSAMLSALLERPTVTDRIEKVNGVDTLVKAHEHVVQNLLSGKDVIEARDTPCCCSVASETYWSM